MTPERDRLIEVCAAVGESLCFAKVRVLRQVIGVTDANANNEAPLGEHINRRDLLRQ